MSCLGLTNIEGLLSQSLSLANLTIQNTPLGSPAIINELRALQEIAIDLEHTKDRNFTKILGNLPLLNKIDILHDRQSVVLDPWIRELPQLNTLRFCGRGPVDLTPVAGMAGVTVVVAATTAPRVIGGELLGEGSRVVFDTLGRLYQ